MQARAIAHHQASPLVYLGYWPSTSVLYALFRTCIFTFVISSFFLHCCSVEV